MENEEAAKSGGCITPSNNLLLPTKKRRSCKNLDGEYEEEGPSSKKFCSRNKSLETERDESDANDIVDEFGVGEIDSGRSDNKKQKLMDPDQAERIITSKAIKPNLSCEHLPLPIPATERKKWPQKPCVYCRKHGVRHDTRYICSKCNIALCKSPCFSDYHSST